MNKQTIERERRKNAKEMRKRERIFKRHEDINGAFPTTTTKTLLSFRLSFLESTGLPKTKSMFRVRRTAAFAPLRLV